MIKVLVVDDSALVRKVLSDIINKTDGMMLLDTAHNPIFAIEKLKKNEADVIMLDIEMPRMDGLTFLQKLMRAKPTPVIILSSLSTKNARITLHAFEYGAFDVLAKPEDILELPAMEESIIQSIRSAAQSGVKNKLKRKFESTEEEGEITPLPPPNRLFTTSRKTTDRVIVIGSSTGGTTAISEILKGLPVDIPGIVIVQHMPLKFTYAFAERLNNELPLTVKIAETGERIQNGYVYISPGDQHCSISVSGAKYLLKLRDGPKVNYHKPSVTVLFNSAANFAGPNTIGVMLTGMGDDGAKAMKEMKNAGAYNIVQDEESSIVWGMPGKAFEYGAASIVLPLNKIADEICKYLRENT
ncbi:MAG: chemotaxis response regulator protein-glutamate methylesterase [Spirochaetales bacterium]|nr:chemotaxis response regulator protein-glutamate methylesterase [Spirochaetales bacterium]